MSGTRVAFVDNQFADALRRGSRKAGSGETSRRCACPFSVLMVLFGIAKGLRQWAPRMVPVLY